MKQLVLTSKIINEEITIKRLDHVTVTILSYFADFQLD